MIDSPSTPDAPTAPDAPALDAQADSVGRDVLEARCGVLEMSVRASGTATAAQLDAARPGGAENPDRSATGWLYFFGALSRWHAMGPTQPTKQSLRWDGAAMDDMRAALAAEPITLTLENGRKVSAFPKSEYALHRMTLLQVTAAWARDRRIALLSLPADDVCAESIDALAKATELEARLDAEAVAIATHPGAGLPWGEDELTWDHHIPTWTRDEVSPFDRLAITRAHCEVNLLRINAIAARTREFVEAGNDPMPLAAFLGTMAADLGVRPADLSRRWSLGEAFASALARFESVERSKAKAERDSGGK